MARIKTYEFDWNRVLKKKDRLKFIDDKSDLILEFNQIKNINCYVYSGISVENATPEKLYKLLEYSEYLQIGIELYLTFSISANPGIESTIYYQCGFDAGKRYVSMDSEDFRITNSGGRGARLDTEVRNVLDTGGLNSVIQTYHVKDKLKEFLTDI